MCDLSGYELDFWCAKALERDARVTGCDQHGAPLLDGRRSLSHLLSRYRDFPQAWSPSTNWQDAAPILEHLYGKDFLVRSLRRFVACELGC